MSDNSRRAFADDLANTQASSRYTEAEVEETNNTQFYDGDKGLLDFIAGGAGIVGGLNALPSHANNTMVLSPHDRARSFEFSLDLPHTDYTSSQMGPEYPLAPFHGEQEAAELGNFQHLPLEPSAPLEGFTFTCASSNAQGLDMMHGAGEVQPGPSRKRAMLEEPGVSGSINPYQFAFTFPTNPASYAPGFLPGSGLEPPGPLFAYHTAGMSMPLTPGRHHEPVATTQVASPLHICSSSDVPEVSDMRKLTNEKDHALSTTLPTMLTTQTSQQGPIDPWLLLLPAWSGQGVDVAPASAPSSSPAISSSSRDESLSEPYEKVFKYKASNPDADLSCKYCPQKFTDPSTRSRHIKQHEKDMSKRCGACGKKCSRRDCLLRHARLAGEASACYWSARNKLGWDPEKGEQQQKKRKKK